MLQIFELKTTLAVHPIVGTQCYSRSQTPYGSQAGLNSVDPKTKGCREDGTQDEAATYLFPNSAERSVLCAAQTFR